MSDLFNWVSNNLNSLPQIVLPFAVLGVSLLGSPHCIAMCGVLCVGVSQNDKRALSLYHLGRLLSYLTLGAVAGFAGQTLLAQSQKPLFLISSILIALLFLLSGLSFLGLRIPGVSGVFQNILVALLKWTKGRGSHMRAFLTGAFSGLLPCGWLYAFVLAAVGTGHLVSGALLLLFFWLGTVPALSATTFYVHKLKGMVKPQFQRFLRIGLAMIFISYAGFIIWNRTAAFRASTPSEVAPACHN